MKVDRMQRGTDKANENSVNARELNDRQRHETLGRYHGGHVGK